MKQESFAFTRGRFKIHIYLFKSEFADSLVEKAFFIKYLQYSHLKNVQSRVYSMRFYFFSAFKVGMAVQFMKKTGDFCGSHQEAVARAKDPAQFFCEIDLIGKEASLRKKIRM